MSLIELSPLFTRRQLKNQKDNNRRRLCLGPGGPEARQGKGSTGTVGGDVASFPLATTFFSYSLLLIHLSFSYFCGTKYIHKLVPKVKSLPPHLQISADIFLIKGGNACSDGLGHLFKKPSVWPKCAPMCPFARFTACLLYTVA